MQATKPQIPRVYVQVFNPLTRKSRNATLYNTDEGEVIAQLVKLAGGRDERQVTRRGQRKSA